MVVASDISVSDEPGGTTNLSSLFAVVGTYLPDTASLFEWQFTLTSS